MPVEPGMIGGAPGGVFALRVFPEFAEESGMNHQHVLPPSTDSVAPVI